MNTTPTASPELPDLDLDLDRLERCATKGAHVSRDEFLALIALARRAKPEGDAPQSDDVARKELLLALQAALDTCAAKSGAPKMSHLGTLAALNTAIDVATRAAPAAQHADSGAQALDGIEKAYRACQNVSSGFDHDSGERLGARACIAAVKELYLAAQSQGAQAISIDGLPRYKLVPGDQREWMAPAADGAWCRFDHAAALVAKAEAPADPLDMPLPCDIKVGAGTMRKGVKLRTLVARMEGLHRMAMDAQPELTPEQRADFERVFPLATQQAATPGALDADEMTRLRRLMRAIGWDHERDESDKIVRGTLFAVLGLAADKLEQAAPSAPGTPEAPQTAATRDVLAERQRQVEQEGWTPAHDDEHSAGQMAAAAACYALHTEPVGNVGDYLHFWPWGSQWWKPKSRRRNLVRAAALILADIERLDRAAQLDGGQGEGEKA